MSESLKDYTPSYRCGWKTDKYGGCL